MKKRLIVILLLTLSISLSYSAFAGDIGDILPQTGKQVGDLSEVESYKGTSRLFLEMFVGCLRKTSEGDYIGAIPHYTSSLFLDTKISDFEDVLGQPTKKFDSVWCDAEKQDEISGCNKDNAKDEVPVMEIDWQIPRKSYKYEGNCYLFANYWHQFWHDNEEVTQDDEAFSVLSDKELVDESGIELNIAQIDETKGLEAPFKGAYYVKNDDYNYKVYWEGGPVSNQQDNCQNFGGKFDAVPWSVDEPTIRCCGDDYLWIMNGVYNFDGNTENKAIDQLCLYGYVDPETGEPLVEAKESQPYHSSAKVGNHPYRKSVYCTPLPAVAETSDYPEISEIHYSYDINNYDPLSTTETRKLFFYDKNNPSNTVTDVGLWKTDTSANYCTHYFNDNGDNFEWLTPERAGEINYFGVGNDDKAAYDKDNIPKIKTIDGEDKFTLNPKAPDYIYDVMTKQLSGDNYINSDDFTICNLFLGGTWTGHHCCGNKYDVDGKKILENFNDEGEDGTHYILAKNRLVAYALSAESSDEIQKKPNKACYQGEAIESGEIRNEKISDDDVSSIINKKGTLLLCNSNIAQKMEILTMSSNYDFNKITDENYVPTFDGQESTIFPNNDNIKSNCDSIIFKSNEDIVNEYNRFAYCFTNNTWLSFDIMDVPYEEETNNEFDILGRYPKEDDVLHESNINPDFKNIKNKIVNSDNGCCFEGDCWNGQNCVANGEIEKNKYVDPNKVYLCANGEWTSGEPTYNWYHEDFGGEVDPDLTGLQYCVDKWACACPEKDAYDLGDEDQHEIDICETYTKPESLCTREPAMFVGDRFCEPTYTKKDGSYAFTDASTIDNSSWTSRTKYLATALLQLASKKSSQEVVLQCDTPKNVLNYYNLDFAEDLFVDEQDYNNFCALKLKTTAGDEEVYLGTTLNPQLNYDEVPEQLYKTKEISEFLQCDEDEDCVEGVQGCYIPTASNVGQCVKICYDDSDCEEEEECFTAEEVPEGDVNIGLCAPTSVKDVDMFNIESLGELFYGDADTTGLLDNDFLFNLASKTFAEAECKTILEGTNPQNGNGDDYLLFKSCDNDKVTFNNFTKAFIFSNNSLNSDSTYLTSTYDEVTSKNNQLIFYSNELKDYYNQNKDKIAEKKEMSIINSISDLDKIYFAQKKDNGIDKVIFGVLERKSDPDASGDPSSKLRYFAVIIYKNIFVDNTVCTELENSSPLLYCGYDDATKIAVIIIPSTPNYDGTDDAVMNYWPDLTAKIRMK